VPGDESHVSVGRPVGHGYGLRKKAKKKEKKRRSANCAEGTLTEIGSKWLKKKKRRSESRENKSLDKKIKENRSTRKIDLGKLSKRKTPPIDALEHLVGKMERQAGEAQKTWVKEVLGFWYLGF
jgi:hypothetical protein